MEILDDDEGLFLLMLVQVILAGKIHTAGQV